VEGKARKGESGEDKEEISSISLQQGKGKPDFLSPPPDFNKNPIWKKNNYWKEQSIEVN
jgi:hypothetical protein